MNKQRVEELRSLIHQKDKRWQEINTALDLYFMHPFDFEVEMKKLGRPERPSKDKLIALPEIVAGRDGEQLKLPAIPPNCPNFIMGSDGKPYFLERACDTDFAFHYIKLYMDYIRSMESSKASKSFPPPDIFADAARELIDNGYVEDVRLALARNLRIIRLIIWRQSGVGFISRFLTMIFFKCSQLVKTFLRLKPSTFEGRSRWESILKVTDPERIIWALEYINANLSFPLSQWNAQVVQTINSSSAAFDTRVKTFFDFAETSSTSSDSTLVTPIYENVVQSIRIFLKNCEQLPATYFGRDEESMRDLILSHLDAQFKGSTTGETFNKKGKTDIIMKHRKDNVFVAECKFWKGTSQHHKAINQLLSYLTWRDRNTAIISFVQSTDISGVIDKIKDSTMKHKRYFKFIGAHEEGMFEFEMRGIGGAKNFHRMAIIVAHFEKS